MTINRAPPIPTRSDSVWSGQFLLASPKLFPFPGQGKTLADPFRWLSSRVFLFGSHYFEANAPTIAFESSNSHIIMQLSSNGQLLIGVE